uniref:Uncharacterized protein n=1 Tax=Oryza barthii TaxID=65489 RepID=A0A0D3HL59_9ORYZ
MAQMEILFIMCNTMILQALAILSVTINNKYYIGGKIYKNRPCRSSFGRQADVAHDVITTPCAFCV